MFSGPAFEPHDEAEIQCVGEPLQGRQARLVLSALDPRDRRMTRSHPAGELSLRESEPQAVVDDKAGDLLVWSKALLLGLVRAAAASAAAARLNGRRANRALVLRGHRAYLITFDKRLKAHHARQRAAGGASLRPFES